MLIELEELKHKINNSKYYGTDVWRDILDMANDCESKGVEWIPCSERPPETLGEYLITVLSNPHKNRVVSAGYYNSRLKEFGTYKTNGSWEKWDVIAWMLLPKPYKEEVDNED